MDKFAPLCLLLILWCCGNTWNSTSPPAAPEQPLPPALTEPPGPWEPLAAILLADIIVIGEWAGEESSNRLRISDTLVSTMGLQSGHRIDLCPAEPVSTGIDRRSLEDFFDQQPTFLAALRWDTAQGCWRSSSNWAYLSFLEPSPARQARIAEIRARAVFGWRQALEQAATTLDVPVDDLAIDLIGGRVEGDRLLPGTDAEDPAAQLAWRVINRRNNRQFLFFALRDGQVLQLLN